MRGAPLSYSDSQKSEPTRTRCMGNGASLQHRLQQPLELRAQGFELFPAVLGRQHIQCGDAARHGHGIAGESARLVGVAVGGEARHDPPRARERAHRHAAADHFAEGGEIRNDTQPLGRAAAGEPKAGNDLVEDEERAMLPGERAQPLEELARAAAAGRGWPAPAR